MMRLPPIWPRWRWSWEDTPCSLAREATRTKDYGQQTGLKQLWDLGRGILVTWALLGCTAVSPGKGPDATVSIGSAASERAMIVQLVTTHRCDACQLPGANLATAQLTSANLRRANLQQANLQQANLRFANLRFANLQGANLQGADLRNTDLRHANLRGANLRGANLRLAILSSANLTAANLTAANLQDADLFAADLRDAQLAQANLQQADTRGSRRDGIQLCQTTLEDGTIAAPTCP